MKTGAPLPPHQLVRTASRRGEPGKAPPIELRHLPAISLTPAAADRIVVADGRVVLPN